jgi:putative ABC transport system permease protein
MESLFQDLRYGARVLVKSPAFTIAAVIALALGIGANTAIFSVVNAVVFNPLPYEKPDQLMIGLEKNPKILMDADKGNISYPDFVDWRNQAQTFEKMAIFSQWGFILTQVSDPEQVPAALVSADFFSLLGVAPTLGRTFSADEDKPGGRRSVILSHGFWQRRFGANPGIIGQLITLNDKIYNIVGVLPPGFEFDLLKEAEIWAPMPVASEEFILTNRGFRADNLVLGRLKPGVTRQQAQAEMDIIAARLGQQYPDTNKDYIASAVPLREYVVGNTRQTLLLMLSAVGFVLLIACANVANLLLAKSVARRREIALRAAIGATRSRLIRQLLTESVLLAMLSGILGFLLAYVGTKILIAVSPENLPRVNEIRVDVWMLGFTLGISLVTGALFGLAPALQGSRSDLNEALKEAGKGSAGKHGNRARGLLVISEVGLTMVLLICAGLLIRSFIRVLQVDSGLKADKVATARIFLPPSRYAGGQKQTLFHQQLLERLENRPNVRAAALINSLPLTGQGVSTSLQIEGRPQPVAAGEGLVEFRVASPKYFEAMGISLLRGRDFTMRDAEGTPGVVIINDALARRSFPNENPLGKRLSVGGPDWREIVGVVANVRHYKLDEEPKPEVYLPYFQSPWRLMTLVARTDSDPNDLLGLLRREVQAVDKDQPVTDSQLMQQVYSKAVASRRFSMLLLVVFGTVALTLAAVGIYGVIAFSVSQRTHEIGVRMALGARRADVFKLVVAEGMAPALIGVFIGSLAALGLTHIMAGMLYGVTATDAMTFITVPLLLGIVALAACLVPARRAAKVDPMVTLRYE